MRQIKASEFKAKCLKLIDEVALGGEAILITKRGKTVARLEAARSARVNPFGRGKGLIKSADPKDDLVNILSREDMSDWYRADPNLGGPARSKAARKVSKKMS